MLNSDFVIQAFQSISEEEKEKFRLEFEQLYSNPPVEKVATKKRSGSSLKRLSQKSFDALTRQKVFSDLKITIVPNPQVKNL